MTMNLNMVVDTSGHSDEQIDDIYDLAQEGQRLGSEIGKDFTELSYQEALFCIMDQSTGYENVASRYPDCYTAYYATMHLKGNDNNEHEELISNIHKKAGQVWLDTNSSLFQHVFEFKTKLVEFITMAEALLQVQQSHI